MCSPHTYTHTHTHTHTHTCSSPSVKSRYTTLLVDRYECVREREDFVKLPEGVAISPRVRGMFALFVARTEYEQSTNIAVTMHVIP